MIAEHKALSQFIENLRRITTEVDDNKAIIKRVRPLVKQLALEKNWIKKSLYECDEEQGFGVHLLHEEVDHSLAVFAVSWLPGRGAPPHNHGTWAVVAGVDGPEKNTFWKRLDDGAQPGYAELKKSGEIVFDAGDVVALLPEGIHSVDNETSAITLSLHVYGKHLNYTGRSKFDPVLNIETPFILKEQ